MTIGRAFEVEFELPLNGDMRLLIGTAQAWMRSDRELPVAPTDAAVLILGETGTERIGRLLDPYEKSATPTYSFQLMAALFRSHYQRALGHEAGSLQRGQTSRHRFERQWRHALR
jgi:DNA-binding NtrC family response regulator